MDHIVEYEQDMSDSALTNVAAALTKALEENGDSLTVGSTTFKAAETPEMLFGEETGKRFLNVKRCRVGWEDIIKFLAFPDYILVQYSTMTTLSRPTYDHSNSRRHNGNGCMTVAEIGLHNDKERGGGEGRCRERDRERETERQGERYREQEEKRHCAASSNRKEGRNLFYLSEIIIIQINHETILLGDSHFGITCAPIV